MMNPMKFSRNEKARLLNDGPKIWEAYNGLECQHRLPKSAHKDVETAIAIARKFNNEVLRPMYLERELKHMEDHDYLSWDILKNAGDWRLYSLFIPKLFGGQGLNFLGLYPFIEEIASVCAGLGHIIFVHYLGIATVFPSFNSRILNKILRDVVEKREGRRRRGSSTWSSPSPMQAPTSRSRSSSTRPGSAPIAKKVKGGYNHQWKKDIHLERPPLVLAHRHVLRGQEERRGVVRTVRRPQREPRDSASAPRKRKWATWPPRQASSYSRTASVPTAWSPSPARTRILQNSKKGVRWIVHSIVDYVVSSSRAGVGAIATGIGRTLYEKALEYAQEKIGQRRPADQPAVGADHPHRHVPQREHVAAPVHGERLYRHAQRAVQAARAEADRPFPQGDAANGISR